MFNPAEYHPKWSLIRRLVLRRAGHVCEWCSARDRYAHPRTGSMVYLSIAHLDRNRTFNRFWNLAALCQRCHLAHDRAFHIYNRRAGRAWQERQEGLGFPDGELLEAVRAGMAWIVPAAKVRARQRPRPVRVWPRPQLPVSYPAPTLFPLPAPLTPARVRSQKKALLCSRVNVTNAQ